MRVHAHGVMVEGWLYLLYLYCITGTCEQLYLKDTPRYTMLYLPVSCCVPLYPNHLAVSQLYHLHGHLLYLLYLLYPAVLGALYLLYLLYLHAESINDGLFPVTCGVGLHSLHSFETQHPLRMQCIGLIAISVTC